MQSQENGAGRGPTDGGTSAQRGDGRRRGIIFVMTGASGVGKDSIRRVAMPRLKNVFYSVSATTRTRRAGEVNGGHYLFIERAEFEDMLENDRLLEWADYVGDYYGTPLEPVERALADGLDVLLELELVGARKTKVRYPDAVMIFIAPPSLSELERRLRGRGTDSEEKIQKRLTRAREEIGSMREFDYVVVNDDLQRAAELFTSVIAVERARAERVTDEQIRAFLRE